MNNSITYRLLLSSCRAGHLRLRKKAATDSSQNSGSGGFWQWAADRFFNKTEAGKTFSKYVSDKAVEGVKDYTNSQLLDDLTKNSLNTNTAFGVGGGLIGMIALPQIMKNKSLAALLGLVGGAATGVGVRSLLRSEILRKSVGVNKYKSGGSNA